MNEKKYLKLNDIDAYKISFHLTNNIWKLVKNWDFFAKDTIGRQFVRAIDSISANIAEGFGRRFKKDKIKFYYYAYGSVIESLDWNEKAKIRGLTNKEQYDDIWEKLNQLPKELNSLIKFTNERMTK